MEKEAILETTAAEEPQQIFRYQLSRLCQRSLPSQQLPQLRYCQLLQALLLGPHLLRLLMAVGQTRHTPRFCKVCFPLRDFHTDCDCLQGFHRNRPEDDVPKKKTDTSSLFLHIRMKCEKSFIDNNPMIISSSSEYLEHIFP